MECEDLNQQRSGCFNVLLSSEEIYNSRLIWLRDVQSNMVKQENYKQLQRVLNIFCDGDGLYRCQGRLKYSPVSYDTNNPFLLTKGHYFTDLIVMESHNVVGHNGVRDTLNHIRGTYWIPKSRNYIRKIISGCQICKRHEGKSYGYPSKPPLPTARVSVAPSFTYIGIDYLGPVYLKNVYDVRDKVLNKTWIALITCASSRSIYLDLATDYSGKACIDVLTRFINRRSAPKEIISDNGSNFTSTEVPNFASSRKCRLEIQHSGSTLDWRIL